MLGNWSEADLAGKLPVGEVNKIVSCLATTAIFPTQSNTWVTGKVSGGSCGAALSFSFLSCGAAGSLAK